MSPKEIETMRCNLRLSAPLLRQEGWEEGDIDAIGQAVKQAIADGNEADLTGWRQWLLWKAKDAYQAFPWDANAIRLCDMVITTQEERDEKARRAREWR